jgi:hypothetical protein
MERTYTHLNYDTRSSYYVGASAIAVPYQLYSDECEIIPGPEGAFPAKVSIFLLILSASPKSNARPHRTVDRRTNQSVYLVGSRRVR